MVLFNGGRNNTGYADAVTTHGHYMIGAIFIQHRGFHGLAVFVAELENMPHFNTAHDGERTLAIRTGIAFHYIANIGDDGFR